MHSIYDVLETLRAGKNCFNIYLEDGCLKIIITTKEDRKVNALHYQKIAVVGSDFIKVYSVYSLSDEQYGKPVCYSGFPIILEEN